MVLLYQKAEVGEVMSPGEVVMELADDD